MGPFLLLVSAHVGHSASKHHHGRFNQGRREDLDFAQDLTKQIITLSAGIIALTITFVKDFLRASPPHLAKVFMGVSWLFYILAVIFGVWTLMGLTGSLDRGTTSPYGWNVRLRSLLQIQASS